MNSQDMEIIFEMIRAALPEENVAVFLDNAPIHCSAYTKQAAARL